MLRAVVKRHGQPISSREVASETGQDETFVSESQVAFGRTTMRGNADEQFELA